MVFRPVERFDGYLPIEDHGLIGDGSSTALVGRDGTISWLCAPRFDSPPLFAGLLDAQRGGAFSIALDGVVESQQRYDGESAVLVTELRSPSASVRIRDALVLRADADLTLDGAADRGELVREVTVLGGSARLTVRVRPYGPAAVETEDGALRIQCARLPGVELHLASTGAHAALEGLESTLALGADDVCCFTLSWRGAARSAAGLPAESPAAESPSERLDATRAIWEDWVAGVQYEGPQRALVRRSAITLKLLDDFAGGGIVAAPTSSLPERIGGSRNWDYRYVWTRDAAFAVYALERVGLWHEAGGYILRLLRAFEEQGAPRVLYTVEGQQPPPEHIADDLEGYRRSPPVRWGNAAAEQSQQDIYGEILDCAYLWTRHHGSLDPALWGPLSRLVEAARVAWDTPGHGIWEGRGPAAPFTYAAALCYVAVDRGARMAEHYGTADEAARWRAEATRIQQQTLARAWSSGLGSFTQHLGGTGGVDASMLALPLRRVVAADDPRMVATTEAIARQLDAGDGLLFRYLPEVSPDGVPGDEGAFLLCSFWMVDNLALQGRVDEALSLFESLCARANPLGLLPEQIDPSTGAFLGNFPQAFSHIGLISSAANLARLMEQREQ